ncbi:MAG TPA: tetratricopeptide repeat protein, partial [Thermoanaerobaculia bacterium]
LAFLLPLLLIVTALALLLPRLYAPLDVARTPADLEKARNLAVEGDRYMKQGEVGKAGGRFRMALKFAPHLPEGWAGLGAYQRYRYQDQQAEGLLRKALALEPGHEPALLLLGEIAYAQGRLDETESLWKRCSDKTSLGRLYLHQGRFPEAAGIFEEEIRKKPGDKSLRKLAVAARAGRLTPDVESLIRPDYSSSRSPLTAQGWEAYIKDRPQEAIPLFAKALAADPKNLVALNGMGWALFDAGRVQESRRYFNEALRVQPDDPVALNGWAHCLHVEGKVEEAMAIWKKIDTIFPGRSSAPKHLAWRYYERGDCERAAGYFVQWISFKREDKEAIAALEDCLQKLNRRPSTPAPQTRP